MLDPSVPDTTSVNPLTLLAHAAAIAAAELEALQKAEEVRVSLNL